jgi:hypothetical protein
LAIWSSNPVVLQNVGFKRYARGPDTGMAIACSFVGSGRGRRASSIRCEHGQPKGMAALLLWRRGSSQRHLLQLRSLCQMAKLPCATEASRAKLPRAACGEAHDFLFGELVAGEFAFEPAVVHDEDTIGDAEDFFEFA